MIDTRTNLGKAAFAGALAAVVVGLCVLVGWQFDLEFPKRIAPDLVAMNPATAVAFILAGASLALFLQSPPGGDRKSRALILSARLCALVVTLVGLAKLGEILFGWDLGVDRRLFASELSDGLRTPNRIAPNTAFNFLLLGSALLFTGVKNRFIRLGVESSAALVGFGALLAVLAYAYDIESFYGLGELLPMALHTAITLSVLAVAFLLAHTDSGLLAIFAGDSAGGTMARRLLPAAVLVPAVFGWLTRQGELAGLYQSGFGEAMFAVGNIVVFTLLICWSAEGLFRADHLRKNAEASLRESETRTSLLVQSSNIGLWDWNLVTNEVFFSPEWKNQLGYADTELTNRFEEWESRLHPEDRERTLATIKDFRESRSARYEVEFRLRHKEGSWRWMLARASTFRDATGQPARIMGSHIDITERKQAETALREIESRLAHAMNLAQLVAWEYDPATGLFTFDDHYYLLHGTTAELEGGHLMSAEEFARKFVHPDDANLVGAEIGKAMATTDPGYRTQLECRIFRRDGEPRLVLTSISITKDAAGRTIQIHGANQDITRRKQDEEALRHSEERFRIAAETANDVVYEWDLKQSVVWMGNIDDLLGYEPGKFSRTLDGWAASVHPEDLERTMAALEAHLEGRAPYAVEYRVRRKDGVYRWWSARGATARTPDGKPTRMIGSITDITEREEAERALRESEEQFRAMVETFPLAIYLSAGVEQKTQYVNTTMAKLFGYTLEEIPTVEQWWPLAYPDETYRKQLSEEWTTRVKRAIETQTPIEPMEVVVTCKDGSKKDIFWGYVTLGDKNYAYGLDVTERKRAEQRITDELNYSHTMLEASPLGIITFAGEGDAVSVNLAAAQIVGSTVQQLEAQNFRNLESWKRSGMLEAADHALKTGQPQDLETHLVTTFGKEVWLSCRFVPFRHNDRGHLLCLLSDITGRKRAEAALEQAHLDVVKASRLAGMAEVATGILHNVGNVLNSVNIASSCVADSIRKSKSASLGKVVGLLREHEADLGDFLTVNPQGRQIPGYLAQLAEHLAGEQTAALKELEHLQKNIEHIKDIVTMQQGFAKVSGTTELFSVTGLVDDALKMNASALARHDILVGREFQEVPLIPVEKHQVLQILVNLVRNSMQACDEANPLKKQITLRVTRGKDGVRISVTDNGIGIPAENLTRLFAHGFTTKPSGHGFGLHSAALAAKKMGGALKVHSDGHRQGATFTLELPYSTREKTYE